MSLRETSSGGSLDILFSKRVPVALKHISSQNSNSVSSSHKFSTGANYTGQVDLEKKHPGITIQVSLASKNSGRLKVLEIHLTDEDDPFFLFQLEIGEDEFHTLRSEQNLLFPVKFVELVEECIDCQYDDHPKFLTQLITDSTSRNAVFNIVETNTFKHITHLSLNFNAGNDTSVKQYLAGLSENQLLKQNLEITNSSMSDKLHEAESTISDLKMKLDHLKSLNAEQISNLQLRHAEDFSKEKEKNIRENETNLRHFEREKLEMENRYEDQIKAVTQKFTSVNSSQTQLSARTKSLEASNENANKQIEQLRNSLSNTTAELEKLTITNRRLDHIREELDRECFGLKEKLQVYERKEREQDERNKRLEEIVASSNEQKMSIEDTLEVYKNQSSRLEDSLKNATEEINKGNEIIRRLQSELKSIKSKVKLKNVVTLQQEKLLDERAASLLGCQKDLEIIREQLTKKQEECDLNFQKVEDLTKKLEENKKTIDDNNHVIEWLHKQMNEDALNRPLASLGLGSFDADKYADKYSALSNDVKKHSPANTYRSRYAADYQAHTERRPSVSPTRKTLPTGSASGIPNYQSTFRVSSGTTSSTVPTKLNLEKHIPMKVNQGTSSGGFRYTSVGGSNQSSQLPVGNEIKRSSYFQ
ncbi:hypothetical protein HK096_010268 [Nowakowskiella sp. JEL0078]|nr:hypothetical protein HK096_010268 [Nowakowskiella sp. JEL0078]